MKYLVLKKRPGEICAQVIIGGSKPFDNAVLKLQLADCTRQDAPAKILAQTDVDVALRPANNWVSVDLTFAWPKKEGEFELSRMSLQVQIRDKVTDQLLYCTKVSYPIDLEHSAIYYWTPTVVAEEV